MPKLAVPPDAAQDPFWQTIRISHALAMFVINETDAATIRTTYEQRGEFSAAVELRQLFHGIMDQCTSAGVRAHDRQLEAAAQAAASCETAVHTNS